MSGSALTTPMPAADASQLLEITERTRRLARDISKNVVCILGALQIGDISRQRAEHVQSGLALLDGLDRSTSQLRLRAAGEMLLAAQLEAALRDYSQEVTKLLPSIEGLASDALALAALNDAVTELGDSAPDLSDLKRRMDAAVQLVAEIQAADGAARYLAGQIADDKGANGAADTSKPTSERHPLDQKACDLLQRIIYLEAAADDCVVILERLKEASDALIASPPAAVQSSTVSPPAGSLKSQKELAASADRIKAILEKVEDDMAGHVGKNTDILRLLDRAGNPAISNDMYGELEAGSYAGLNFTSADPGADDAFSDELSALLSRIDRLYAMSQERDVHRAFSKACGLEIAEDTETTEDGLF